MNDVQTAQSPPPASGHQHGGSGDVLCITNLSFAYYAGLNVLEQINLHVGSGSCLGLVGPNGAGKTTLMRIILGLLEGYQGEVRLMGLTPRQARERGTVIGWAPQNPAINWNFPVTARQVVEMGLRRRGWFAPIDAPEREHVDRLFRQLDIAALGERPIGELSGGQRQRVIIARALAPKPVILALDEPQVGIDQAGKQRFQQLIGTLKHEFQMTLIIISHDLQTVITSCDRIACLNRQLHFHDAPQGLSAELLGRVFQCDLDGLLPSSCAHHASGDSMISAEEPRA